MSKVTDIANEILEFVEDKLETLTSDEQLALIEEVIQSLDDLNDELLEATANEDD